MFVAVIEDDDFLRDELLRTFVKAGYDVRGFADAESGSTALSSEQPVLAVVDVGLPGKSGYSLISELRGTKKFPVLVLTARDTLTDELTALGLGADDFLTKPCPAARLLARAKRLTELYSGMRNEIKLGEIRLDCDSFNLTSPFGSVVLPETEGKILSVLMKRYPVPASADEIFAEVWGTRDFVDENILRVNITRLRKNLAGVNAPVEIVNIRSEGYIAKLRTDR